MPTLPTALAQQFPGAEPLGPARSAWRVRHDQGTAILKYAPAASSAAARLLDEAERLRALPLHPHLPALVDCREDGDTSLLLLEDVGGRDLDSRWRSNAPPLGEVLAVAADISGALAHLHAHGLVHLDVTEGNIVAAENRYVLVDLGIGVAMGDRHAVTVDGSGTDRRRAPEVAHPGRKATPAADVYALGAVLTDALLGGGGRAWPPSTAGQLAACHLDPGANAHRRLVKLLSAALELRPAARPTSAEFHREIGRLAADRSRWPARPLRRGAAVGAAALCIVLVTAGVFRLVTAPPVRIGAGELPRGPAGYLGVPFFLDADTIVVFRHKPMWTATSPAPALLSELQLELHPEPRWTIWATLSGNAVGGQVGDLDRDGQADIVTYERPPTGPELHRVLWGPDYTEDPARYLAAAGRPLVIPSGEGPELLVSSAEGASVIHRWSGSTLEQAASFPMDDALAWLDVDGDGSWEVLGTRAGQLALHGSNEATPLPGARPLTGTWVGTGSPLAVADIDADGDEDVVFLDTESGVGRALRDDGDALTLVDLVGVAVSGLLPEAQHGYQPIQLVDLDSDGLPDVLLPSGGFPPLSGPSLAWRNDGDLRFSPLDLPWSDAHDGARLLAIPHDDGQVGVVDLSINDALESPPTHRLWVARSSLSTRSTRVAYPLGSVLRSPTTGWLRVVRDAGPVLVPSAVGKLLVRYPGGEEAPEGDPPGHPAVSTHPTPDTVGRWQTASGELLHRRGAENDTLDLGDNAWTSGPLTHAWGCDGSAPCLFLEGQAAGGWKSLLVDTTTAAIRRLDHPGDMIDASAARADFAVSAKGAWLQRREASTYAALGAPVALPPGLRCNELAASEHALACCSLSPGRLTVFDQTLRFLWDSATTPDPSCSVVAVGEDWVVGTSTGAARLSRDRTYNTGRQTERIILGGGAHVTPAGASLLLTLPDEVVWVTETLDPLSGLFSPGIGTLHPTSGPWPPSASPMATSVSIGPSPPRP